MPPTRGRASARAEPARSSPPAATGAALAAGLCLVDAWHFVVHVPGWAALPLFRVAA